MMIANIEVKSLVNIHPDDFTGCEHQWIENPYDYDSCQTQVVCSLCHCPGELDEKTGELVYPTT